MKCPLCCQFVPTEEQLQDHYLTTCPGLAESDEGEGPSSSGGGGGPTIATVRKKFQFVSRDSTDPEIFLLTTLLDTPQITLTRVSEELYQSEEVVMPVKGGEFEGQLVIGDDVLSVVPFTTTGSIITLRITKQELETWSSRGSKPSSLASASKPSSLASTSTRLKHSASMSSISSSISTGEGTRRRRTLSDQSSARDEEFPPPPVARSDSSSSALASDLANRTSSKDSLVDQVSRTRRKRRYLRKQLPPEDADRTMTPGVGTGSQISLPLSQEKEVQELRAEISKLRIENRKQAKELNTLSKVIDGQGQLNNENGNESGILRRENGELRSELTELRRTLLRQEQNHHKKVAGLRSADPVDDWRKAQMDKLHRLLAEAEQKAEEASTERCRLEEELLRSREKITQLRETRDTLRTSNDNMVAEIKSTTSKLEAEISELHTKYLAQSRELDEAEKLAQGSASLRSLVERLTEEKEDLSREVREVTQEKAAAEAEVQRLQKRVSSMELEMEFKKREPTAEDRWKSIDWRKEEEVKKRESDWKKEDEQRKKEVDWRKEDDLKKRDLEWMKEDSGRKVGERRHPLTSYENYPAKTLNFDDEKLSSSTPLKSKGTALSDIISEQTDVSLPTKAYSNNKQYLTNSVLEEDDTYREALAIVEKYKKLDMENISEPTTKATTTTTPASPAKKWNDIARTLRHPAPPEVEEEVGNKWAAEEPPPPSKQPWESEYISRANASEPWNAWSRDTPTRAGHEEVLRSSYCGRTFDLNLDKRSREQSKATPPPPSRTNHANPPASEVIVGSRVVFKRGGELERGTVRYTGRLVGKDGLFAGVELNNNTGNHDGTYQGQTYFKCKAKRGVFVPMNKIQMVYST